MGTKHKPKNLINRAARFHYDIKEKIIAGIQLRGYEVKGIRENRVALQDGFVKIEGGEAWLYNMHIGLPSNARIDDYDSKQKRKLLLRKSEISRLEGKIQEKNVTAVPLGVKWKNNRIKIVIGIGKGKKKHDKRRQIQERESKREIRRLMKQQF